jgi:hypothetical protein
LLHKVDPILLNIINSNYDLMPQNINVNKSAKQFTVLDAISRTIEDADKITNVMKMNNAEVELFKMTLCFRDRFLSNKKRVFMPKGLSAHSSVFNLSGSSRWEALRFDS